MKEIIWFSLCSDRKFKTEAEAWKSGEDFQVGEYCHKCKCITTTECGCK